MNDVTEENVKKSKYLVFALADQLIATPLIRVREIVNVPNIRKIPMSNKDFEGVMSLRGKVIGVFDLRKRFGLESKGSQLALVIEVGESTVGVMIDEVTSVLELSESDVDSKSQMGSSFSRAQLIGVAQTEKGLVSVVDLSKCFGVDEVGMLNTQKLSA